MSFSSNQLNKFNQPSSSHPSPPFTNQMDWTRGQIIDRGSTATVSLGLGTGSNSGEIFAVKSIELSKSQFLQREQRIHSLISCPEIVSCMGFDVTEEKGKLMYNLLMEYVSGGTLSDEIQKHGGFLDESTIRSYTHSILRGLDYLHSNGLVHCDIKGRNVLIGEDGAKIADLGCARLVHEGAEKPISGTPLFMAPEVTRGEEQGCPADVWALGCTVIEMATGNPPWLDFVVDPVSVLYRIGFVEEVPEVPSFLSEQAKDFLSKCVARDPMKRWTVNQLLKHPFLDEPSSYSKRLRDSTWNSPTSILDQGIWDSLEESETLCDMSHTGSSNSLPERIRRLSCGVSSSSPRLPNWRWDENWVTVRSNRIDDRNRETISGNGGELATTSGSITDWIDCEEGLLESSVVVNGDLLNYGPVNDSNTSSSSSRRGFMMECNLCKCKKDDFFIREELNFERYEWEFLFPSIKIHLKS